MIYLDYSANTPADPAVLDAFVQTERAYLGNPNSAHPAGTSARKKLAETTDKIADLLKIQASEIIYTSGASEANNLAVKGIARAQRNYGKHIISTALEHPSVSGPLTWLQEQGYEIDLVDIGRDGKIDTEHLKELLRDDTILVAVTAVDSELGVIQPVEEIAQIVKTKPNCRLHVDATQAIGKIPFSFEGFDTVSLGAHKFYGLNGSGILFKKKDVVIDPLIHGGSGATLYRSGTPTLALAVSFETALRRSLEALPQRWDRVHLLNKRLREAFKAYPRVRINCPDDAVPHILNVSVSGIKGAKMQQILSNHDVCVSVKSACSTEGTPSRAVFAVSKDRKNALSSWRISLSHLTTEDEIERFLAIFDECLKEMAV
jgi:cysteine desulfurase